MRHATAEGLDQVEPMLAQLRLVPGLVEKNRGTFYRKSRAFLHFHEDPSGLYADVRFGQDFERVRVESDAEQQALLSRIHTL